MLDSILAASTGSVTLTEILLCTGATLLFGLVIALVSMYRNVYTKNFILTLALLPAMVQAVIMIVNGNLGTGVAVAGAFSLVRFRSAPGNAREITGIFFAMVVGLAAGMGYLAYAGLFTLIISLVILFYTTAGLGSRDPAVKTLRVMISEEMEYNHAFDDLFKKYTNSFSLDRTRTTNLGGLFELQYTISLKKTDDEKEFLDEIRQRNGNLSISCSRVASAKDEL